MWKNNLFLPCLVVVCLFLILACVSTPIPSDNQTEITLERTGCFGLCPAYTLALYGDGRVYYEGYDNVEIVGKRIGSVNLDHMHKLIYEFGKADFFSLEDRYISGGTDAPTFIISLKISNKKKRIEHYGCPPQELVDLEYKIDEITNSRRWVGQYSYQRYAKPNCAELFPEQPISPLR